MSPEESFLRSILFPMIEAHLRILAPMPRVAAFLKFFPPALSQIKHTYSCSVISQATGVRPGLLNLRVLTGLTFCANAFILFNWARSTFWLSTLFLHALCQTPSLDLKRFTASLTLVLSFNKSISSTDIPCGHSSSVKCRLIVQAGVAVVCLRMVWREGPLFD